MVSSEALLKWCDDYRKLCPIRSCSYSWGQVWTCPHPALPSVPEPNERCPSESQDRSFSNCPAVTPMVFSISWVLSVHLWSRPICQARNPRCGLTGHGCLWPGDNQRPWPTPSNAWPSAKGVEGQKSGPDCL